MDNLEFSLKNVCNYTETKALDSAFKRVTPVAIQCVLDSLEAEALVYILYRDLKKTIDNVFEEIGVK